MPTYTVLGGTGSTGCAVIRALIEDCIADLNLRIYVRSQKKRLSLTPSLASKPKITIIEGSFSDQETMKKCLQGSDAIFSCIATNNSEPNMDLSVKTAACIISCLQEIQSTNKSEYTTPIVVMLSSASVNTVLASRPKGLFEKIVKAALRHLYSDLEQAEKLYRDTLDNDPGLLTPIFAQPPAIMPGETATGYVLSVAETGDVVSFADLGVAMVEMVERKEEFAGKEVMIVATGEVKQDWGPNFRFLLFGSLTSLFPGIWKIGRQWSWW
jgi:putative NADH-flavin reductase